MSRINQEVGGAMGKKASDPVLTGDLFVGTYHFKAGTRLQVVQDAINGVMNKAMYPESGARLFAHQEQALEQFRSKRWDAA